jgi:hypothetical protein
MWRGVRVPLGTSASNARLNVMDAMEVSDGG